jgi:hypothetical protein
VCSRKERIGDLEEDKHLTVEAADASSLATRQWRIDSCIRLACFELVVTWKERLALPASFTPSGALDNVLEFVEVPTPVPAIVVRRRV